jgi:UPF0755 protein
MEERNDTPSADIREETPTRIFAWTRKRKIIFCCIVAGIVLFSQLLSAPSTFPQAGIVTVPEGETIIGLSHTLADGGYIRSPFAFVTLVTLFGAEYKLAVGDYFFETPKGVVALARQIAHGDHNVVQIKVTIPEGENVREIAGILSQKLPQVNRAEFIQKAAAFEGYLFPETYFFYPTATADSVLTDMQNMFNYKTKALSADFARSGKTENEILTMASLIEREAHGTDDRAVIAGILWNRLDSGMPLQVDATVAYANAIPEGMLTKKYFSIDSPYNTYLYKGLPPRPIANPGLESINSALNPTKTPYLYYLHDSHGSIHYAKTYAEHTANIRKYLQ